MCPHRASATRARNLPDARLTGSSGRLTQEVVGPSSGQPISIVRRPRVVWQPGEPIPKIEAPSVEEANPSWVSSRNEPNFSTRGF